MEFCDGSTSNSPNPNHNYSSDGTYDITLIAYTIGSDTLTQSITLDITELPPESLYSCLPSTLNLLLLQTTKILLLVGTLILRLNLINKKEKILHQELNATATFYLKKVN